MSLVEQLQLQATKLRKPGTTRPSAEPATGSETTGAEPAPPQKPLAEMSLIEQLQLQASKLKKPATTKPPTEPVVQKTPELEFGAIEPIKVEED